MSEGASGRVADEGDRPVAWHRLVLGLVVAGVLGALAISRKAQDALKCERATALRDP